jgi:hypothetical protein
VLKLSRNNLLSKNLIFGDKLVTFQHIRNLYDIEKDKPIKVAHKLTIKHVEMNSSFDKMKVFLAAQVLSETVARAIQFYVGKTILSEDHLATADYALFIDQLFDMFNSSSIVSNNVCTSQFATKY